MLRYRRLARDADVVHFQWLSVQQLDGHLLPRPSRDEAARARPLVLTAHDILPARAAPGPAAPRSGGCTSASTRSSSTPSTAARA